MRGSNDPYYHARSSTASKLEAFKLNPHLVGAKDRMSHDDMLIASLLTSWRHSNLMVPALSVKE